MPRGDLFPEIGPYETGYLPLSGGHVMYWEQVGNPRGKPVLFLHGGPGAGAGAVHRRFFDPSIWRVIIFDQRGAGRSKPLGEIAANTTPHLVEDIESLRKFLNIERLLLFGGSWGSTLALAYAQAHPETVMGLVLRGIFLGRPEEVEWFLYGMARVFPDAHAAFSQFLPPEERGDLLKSYLARLTNPDPEIHGPAARTWSIYEGSCSTLLPSFEAVTAFAQDRAAIGLARIEAHYFEHDLFLPTGGLLAHMNSLHNIPGEIVQGRYDMICPAKSAFDLLAAWPLARLTLVPDAGHSALEPGIRTALIAALERCRALT
ncbi:MAG: prolyl aminopeptidase [Acidocella sp. 20-57-95]|nr:MAG: prolyl aminopeptidase [Acidocella sp. 20-57-95]OYV62326.1 MAG: prolyl aminopeptidase [Acidocella sp. 21-58-7]HQT63222.1 prolyl aminopeptidase [Acidocella sp.]HQU03791.1 prolyl aminopeptidase [Acidocella sp.]